MQDAVTICTLGIGTAFGESILDNTPRHATIVSRETSELLRIEQREFKSLWEVRHKERKKNLWATGTVCSCEHEHDSAWTPGLHWKKCPFWDCNFQPSIVIVPLTTRGLSTVTVPSVPPIRYTCQVTLNYELMKAQREREKCVCTVKACVVLGVHCFRSLCLWLSAAFAGHEMMHQTSAPRSIYVIYVWCRQGGGILQMVSAGCLGHFFIVWHSCVLRLDSILWQSDLSLSWWRWLNL